MTDNVIDFPTRLDGSKGPDLIIVCGCGCQTMIVSTAGWLECSTCGDRMDDDLTGYVREGVVEVEKPGNLTNLHHYGTEEMAFRKTLNSADPSSTVAVAVVDRSGTIYSWCCDPETDDQREWMLRWIESLKESWL